MRKIAKFHIRRHFLVRTHRPFFGISIIVYQNMQNITKVCLSPALLILSSYYVLYASYIANHSYIQGIDVAL